MSEYEDEGPAIACSSMHEHDPIACAAPSVAEMTLDVVGARLAALHARIGLVFADETADRHFALERAQEEIGELLGLLGLAPEPVLSWVLYRPGEDAADAGVAAGPEGSATAPDGPVELARELLIEHAQGRAGWFVKVYGPDDRALAWSEWMGSRAVSYSYPAAAGARAAK